MSKRKGIFSQKKPKRGKKKNALFRSVDRRHNIIPKKTIFFYERFTPVSRYVLGELWV